MPAQLLCTVSSRLSNGLNGIKIENQGKQSMLIFFNVSEEDYGNYTCVAMNTMGITNASIILYGEDIHDVYMCKTCKPHGRKQRYELLLLIFILTFFGSINSTINTTSCLCVCNRKSNNFIDMGHFEDEGYLMCFTQTN